MNDPRRLADVDPAWHAYQNPEMVPEEFPAPQSQPSTSNARRGVKRRKDSGQVDADNARRGQGMVAPGHIGSDGFGHGMMIGPGAGVNPEDIHPQLDFTAFDHETVAGYLERNNAIPKFGYGSIHSVWDVNAKATDPRLLFIDEPEPIQTMLPGPGMVGSHMIPHLNVMQSGKGNSYGKDASQPHQASTRESNREGRATKRRSTATSMVAAAIEESITMAEEEERKRKERESDQNAQGQIGGQGQDQAEGNGTVIGEDGRPKTVTTEGHAGTGVNGEDAVPKDEDPSGENPDSPPAALRRSSRKPLPAGTSLAVTYRNTRPSPSPTPSLNSEDEDDTDPFVPILADLDMARKVFADRASRHWRDALAAGGGATVQGPGVNPAFAGQVMMGGTGGMMREGEVVAEFLYSTRVKHKALKVAPHYPVAEVIGDNANTSALRSR